MERFDSEQYLTTTQVADLLSVHPSTVKRWCNEGDLDVDKTRGGHRRIHLDDAVALARARGVTTFLERFSPHEGDVWSAVSRIVEDGSFESFHELALAWVSRGHVHQLGWLVYELGRHPFVPFDRFCDEGVRGFMRAAGDAWRSGRLCVGEAHMATESVVEALLRLRAADGQTVPPMPAAGGRGPPVAVVGAMEGDRHHLGALCVRLLLERSGWLVYYLGADVPLEDYAAIQRSRSADLVCVSFAPPNSSADMRRCVLVLAGFYDRDHPYALALGGDIGEVPDTGGLSLPFLEFDVYDRIGPFGTALAGGFGRSRPATGG